jgi:prephenate dehydrogenase
MQKIAILGPGLLGGSIALKLRELGSARVALWARRPEAVEEINRRGCADEAGSSLAEIVHRADLVILCMPVGAMPGVAREIAPLLDPQTLVTDVGSVKKTIVAELSAIFAGRARFVGSHPMAGSEKTGLRAAKATLFAGTTCIVTPDEQTPEEAASEVTAFWESLGCRVCQLSPAGHDAAVALVSHLPHTLAATLVQTVAASDPAAFALCGPGFRDTTRVASGPPSMWVEIMQTNREALASAVGALIAKLQEFSAILAQPDGSALHDFLAAAKTTRDGISFPR